MALELQKKTYSVHIRFFYGSCRTASSAKSEILPHLPYAGLEHRAAFPPQADAAAGMRVTEVRKAGWHIERRPENHSFDDVGNVEKYTNDCMNGARYSTEQEYTYDALYQLIKAGGITEDNPYAIPVSSDYQKQFMISKIKILQNNIQLL